LSSVDDKWFFAELWPVATPACVRRGGFERGFDDDNDDVSSCCNGGCCVSWCEENHGSTNNFSRDTATIATIALMINAIRNLMVRTFRRNLDFPPTSKLSDLATPIIPSSTADTLLVIPNSMLPPTVSAAAVTINICHTRGVKKQTISDSTSTFVKNSSIRKLLQKIP
jgi:hypothetical protein